MKEVGEPTLHFFKVTYILFFFNNSPINISLQFMVVKEDIVTNVKDNTSVGEATEQEEYTLMEKATEEKEDTVVKKATEMDKVKEVVIQ